MPYCIHNRAKPLEPHCFNVCVISSLIFSPSGIRVCKVLLLALILHDSMISLSIRYMSGQNLIQIPPQWTEPSLKWKRTCWSGSNPLRKKSELRNACLTFYFFINNFSLSSSTDLNCISHVHFDFMHSVFSNFCPGAQNTFILMWRIISTSNCTVLNSFCLWFRNELAFRLPEFDQDSSDAENMDSESLVSSESLLEDHVSLDSEGQYWGTESFNYITLGCPACSVSKRAWIRCSFGELVIVLVVI